MKKIILLLSSILVFTISSGCDLWQKTSPQNQETEKAAENPIAQATFNFDFGDGTTKNFVLPLEGEKTVYDLLSALAGQNQIKLETQESSLGILIQAFGCFGICIRTLSQV